MNDSLVIAVSYLTALQKLYEDEATRILYLLVLIIFLMMVDFASGLIKAWRSGTLNSGIGKKGLTTKILIVFVLVALIPLHVIIPTPEIGYMFLYTAYVGYALFEFMSIVENMKEMGINIDWLSPFAERLKAESPQEKAAREVREKEIMKFEIKEDVKKEVELEDGFKKQIEK